MSYGMENILRVSICEEVENSLVVQKLCSALKLST